jgi:hypothetical protein
VDGFSYQTLSVIATQFNHANIALPKKWDTIMSYLIVFQTCIKYTIIINYPIPTVITEIYFQFGTVFSGHSEHFPKKKLYMELTHMKNEEHNELKNLLKIPFKNNVPRKELTIKKNRFYGYK